ncbi:MAG TPA: Dabb family protein [Pyrinomonadaceae bacterium]|nr:Dabb family protein [Pyrinomonadaceae bacterium]
MNQPFFPFEIMLTHIVVWKYRGDVKQAEREKHVALLRHLPSVIAEMESFSVGFDMLHLPRSYHTGLVATFRDRAALEAYTVHPEHTAVAYFGRSISEHVASVDFESEE